MTAKQSDDERNVIPLWRTFRSTTTTNELRSLSSPAHISGASSTPELRTAFESGALGYLAADYLSALISNAAESSQIKLVAEAISESTEDAALRSFAQLVLTASVREVPTSELDPRNSADTAKNRIPELRHALTNDPKNAVKRVDLALAHTILGNRVEARRQMDIALRLAPVSRFVLRSASRLYIHDEEFERAREVLIRSGTHTRDPWILAATLSAGEMAERPTTEMRLARELLSGGKFAPRDLAELGSEVATIELRAGNAKTARRLFTSALADPNENAVAQAEWASTQGGVPINEGALSVTRGFEARARAHARLKEWSEATREGLAWQADQPFALEPAMNISYSASLRTEDYRTALSAALVGIRSHPHEPMLRNNAAFAHANLGDLAKARALINQINVTDGIESWTTTATSGLISFREGDFVGGRAKYLSALDGFQRDKRNDMAVIAAALWALEELRAGLPSVSEPVAIARRISLDVDDDDASLVLSRMEQRLREFPAASTESRTKGEG